MCGVCGCGCGLIDPYLYTRGVLRPPPQTKPIKMRTTLLRHRRHRGGGGRWRRRGLLVEQAKQVLGKSHGVGGVGDGGLHRPWF